MHSRLFKEDTFVLLRGSGIWGLLSLRHNRMYSLFCSSPPFPTT
uniref:Uncharacterized protein n=1 Tax=Arundo donax TaxID=35708 RepID=A0A0A9DAL3_ARUDO